MNGSEVEMAGFEGERGDLTRIDVTNVPVCELANFLDGDRSTDEQYLARAGGRTQVVRRR
ncbi:MAG: hypothetical protein ABEJ28_08070 [Salinigranum sp.]